MLSTPQLGKLYNEHQVFDQLKKHAEFYRSLSWHTMSWISGGTIGIINLNTYVFSSLEGTMESIHDILIKGRINDAYGLLRKYYDATMINIYSNIYLEDQKDLDNLIVSHINDWIKGKKPMPEYRVIAQYVKKAKKLQSVTQLLLKDDSYKQIRKRCNEHTHYNFYRYILLNNNEVHIERIKHLDQILVDINALFIQHVSYLFYLHPHYMMSSDYVEDLECDLEADPEKLKWVASFIHKMIDEVIKKERNDLADLIKLSSSYNWDMQ